MYRPQPVAGGGRQGPCRTSWRSSNRRTRSSIHPAIIDSDGLLAALEGVDTVLEAIDRFDLFGAIDNEQYQQVAREFVEGLPPSLDAAVMAVVRSAL